MNRISIVAWSLFWLILPCRSFNFNDCTYDETTSHVKYLCNVDHGSNFGRRSIQVLYCNNVESGIDRANIHELSFSGCASSEMSYNLLDVFTGLRVLNISFVNMERLGGNDLRFSKYLEIFLAPHNRFVEIPGNFFSHTSELTEIDLSHNRIEELDAFLFDHTRKLITINVSFNSIGALNKRLFSNLHSLVSLDVSNNRIKKIENELFSQNKQIKAVQLTNNQVTRLECKFLLTLVGSKAVISLNTLEAMDISCSNSDDNIETNIEISSKDSPTALQVTGLQFRWNFKDQDFKRIRLFNLTSNRIQNISTIMQAASQDLETLDISDNFLGKLNATSFEKFTNLKQLYLRRTNLSNFQFATFYHQRNLERLDISYNNLNNVNFTLFLRNFKNLVWLNLEGNSLTEIDTVTRSNFPRLSVLGISKNDFSCDYLAKFLLQWHDLAIIYNPSNQTHIDGVDCLHTNSKLSSELSELNTNHVEIFNDFSQDENQQINTAPNSHLEELFTIKILLAAILFVICVYFVVSKGKRPFDYIKNLVANRSSERSVSYNQKNALDCQLLSP